MIKTALQSHDAKDRTLTDRTDHAIRILKELCEVQASKPREFIVATVEFGIALCAARSCAPPFFSGS